MKNAWGVWCAVAMLGVGAVPASAAPAMRQAQLSSVAGEVEWLPSGTDTWQAAMSEQQLSSGDKIRTGGDGQVTLSLDEGSTIELAAGSEFSIQTLSKDAASEQMESIFGILTGKLTAIVSPVAEGSLFQIQTPRGTVEVPAAGADPALTITINPDSSVTVGSTDGDIVFFSAGENAIRVVLSTGEEALVAIDPETGTVIVTSLAGTFDVIGSDGTAVTLAAGDTVSYTGGGAATFVSGTPPVGDAPAAETISEPVT